jgi:hypothetical protein
MSAFKRGPPHDLEVGFAFPRDDGNETGRDASSEVTFQDLTQSSKSIGRKEWRNCHNSRC